MRIEPVEISQIAAELQASLPSFNTSIELPIALIAYDRDKPVGAVVATLMKKALSAEILSLEAPEEVVLPLLKALEKVLREKGCYLVCMSYLAERPLEHALASLGWGKPFLNFKRYVFDEAFFPKQWLKHAFAWPQGFTEFPWKDLTPEELTKLKARHDAGAFPASVSPFHIENLEPLNSLGVRDKNEVVGWLLTQRTASDTLCYKALYIHPRLRFSGLPIQLLAHAINLQLKHKIRWGIFDLNEQQTSSSWAAFIKKRLAPFAQQIIPYNRTWKALN